MLWIVAPLFITLFLIQLYFGRNKEEELGWNSAYGNCIALIFVAVYLAKYIYETHGIRLVLIPGTDAFYNSLFVLIIFFHAFALLFLDFFHALPKKVGFFLGSSITIDVFAFISIVIVYSTIPLDVDTLAAGIFLLFVFIFVFRFIRLIIPPSRHAKEWSQRRHIKKVEEERVKKMKRTRKINQTIDALKSKEKLFKRIIKKIKKRLD